MVRIVLNSLLMHIFLTTQPADLYRQFNIYMRIYYLKIKYNNIFRLYLRNDARYNASRLNLSPLKYDL